MSEIIPFRLRLLRNLTTLLQGITPANGYHFDLSDRVFRGRTIFGEGDPVPLVSILDAVKGQDMTRSPPDSTTEGVIWPLLIQGWAENQIGDNPADQAHYLMADVKRAIALHKAEHGHDYNWLGMNGAIINIRYNGGVVRPPEENISDVAYFWLLVDITLAEDNANPYA